jgi:hypothetical protein
MKGNFLSFPFISFLESGAFQHVTADSNNKKNPLSKVTLHCLGALLASRTDTGAGGSGD